MSERIRQPQPVLRRRVPSRRGALEQPNATSDSPARLTLHFWAAAVCAGVATGLLGALMVGVLRLVQHAAYEYRAGPFAQAVEAASPMRRLLVLAAAGAVLGPVLWLVRRRRWRGGTEVDDVLWSQSGLLSFPRSLLTGALSEVAVGAGASVGREAAPKLLGGASAGRIAAVLGLDAHQQRLLIACGAGAGLACVYDVPVAGALLAVEVLLGQITLPVVLPAVVVSAVATATTWPLIGDKPVYPGVPSAAPSGATLVYALVLGAVLGLVAVAFVRLVGLVSHHQARGRWLLVSPLLVLSLLGVLAGPLPLLLGNGKDIARAALTAPASQSLQVLLLLAVLKPLVTSACLGAGVNGGLLTPVLATGAAFGAAAGTAAHHLWTHGPSATACALLGAAALAGAAMQAPLTAAVLVVELTQNQTRMLVPILLATGLACVIARHLDGYSIYSARLTARTQEPALLN